MRFELHIKEKKRCIEPTSRQKEQQRTTLRSHPSYQARTKHTGVGVAPFDFTGFGQESSHRQPGQTCSEEFFCFSWERGKTKVEKGELVARRQKGQAYSGFEVTHERGQDDSLRDHIGQRRRELGYSAAERVRSGRS